MIRNITLTLLMLLLAIIGRAQTTTSFSVGGDFNKFYPVFFLDAEWSMGKPTEINLGRSDTHANSLWRGSMISHFAYHTGRWGSGSAFIDADIYHSVQPFIAGWADATVNNSNFEIIIWLRGGGTTYNLNSLSNVSYRVHDGVQNPLPFAEINGPNRDYKTTLDNYVVGQGKSVAGDLRIGNSLLVPGSVGIGTASPAEKLSVNGKIRAHEIKVEATNWPDYVFEEGYRVGTLEALESYLKTHKHLPEMPSAKEVEGNGVALGEMNKLLLKKIEELTLHLIEKDKEVKKLKSDMETVKGLLTGLIQSKK